MSAGLKPLKPCPFCGSPAELLHTKSWDYFVRCADKGCAARTRQYHENDVGAVDAWNTRAERTCYADRHGGYTYRFECSACGYSSLTHNCEMRMDELPRYCPNCGAKVVDA